MLKIEVTGGENKAGYPEELAVTDRWLPPQKGIADELQAIFVPIH